MVNTASSGKMVVANLAKDASELELLPLKVKYINTKILSKRSKTVIVDLNDCDQLNLLGASKSKTIISSHDNLLKKNISSTSLLTEGDTYIQKRKTKKIISQQDLFHHSTEHPAVLMHSEYFQSKERNISTNSPANFDNKPRSGRRRWRRESVEPVRLTPEPTKLINTNNVVSPIPVYECTSPKQQEINPNLQITCKETSSKNKKMVANNWGVCESESSQVLMKYPDRQTTLALLRRSKSGQVTGSKKETKTNLPKSANLRKKPNRFMREVDQNQSSVFGTAIQAGPRPVADEVKVGVNTKISGSYRKQWSKPNPAPEFRGQEPSDVESMSEVESKRSSCSVDANSKIRNVCEKRKSDITIPTKAILDSFHTHRVTESKFINVLPISDVSSSDKEDEDNVLKKNGRLNCEKDDFPFDSKMIIRKAPSLSKIETMFNRQYFITGSHSSNPIVYMSELFKTECLSECGPWQTRSKKLAWPQEVLEEALRTLSNDASHAKSAAIQTIGRLAAFYPEVAESEQLALVRGLTREINDPRPYVARLSLVCLMLLFSRLRFNMIQSLMETCNVLLTVLVTAKCNVLKRDVVSALNHLPDLVVPQQAIQVLLTLVQRYSEPIVQETVSRCIVSVLERKGSAVVLHAPPLLTELVLVAATNFCVDLHPAVSENGLKVIRMLQAHPTFDIVFKNHVSAETVRMVMSFIKSVNNVA